MRVPPPRVLDVFVLFVLLALFVLFVLFVLVAFLDALLCRAFARTSVRGPARRRVDFLGRGRRGGRMGYSPTTFLFWPCRMPPKFGDLPLNVLELIAKKGRVHMLDLAKAMPARPNVRALANLQIERAKQFLLAKLARVLANAPTTTTFTYGRNPYGPMGTNTFQLSVTSRGAGAWTLQLRDGTWQMLIAELRSDGRIRTGSFGAADKATLTGFRGAFAQLAANAQTTGSRAANQTLPAR